MSKIAIIPRYEEKNGISNGDPISKIYTIDGIEVIGEISPYSVAPLRILTYVLSQKGINYQVYNKDDNPWEIVQILLDDKYAEYAKVALKEIMEYRCSYEAGCQYEKIIRQLPFEVAMKTSQNIMNFGKTQEEHCEDITRSIIKGEEYNMIFKNNSFGESDNITISRSEPSLRKHLIYKSAYGGYNIKTRGYYDSSLEHYCYIDSKKWD